jgi:RNA polymerase sigma factor (sigma-70 family)
MGTVRAGTILSYVRDLLEAEGLRGVSDGELLRRFAVDRDEQAFAALLQRHAATVWAVCRHQLRSAQDAEDAFQATFLVLARKAGTVRRATSLGSWLHGVAFRIATRARQSGDRRQARERKAAARAPVSAPPEQAWHDLQAALDEEIQRLPERYRTPFVLCCLEGKPRAEAAVELRCGEGTLSGRIARARELLQRRLARRGMTLSAALGALDLWRRGPAAEVPPALLRAAAHGAGDAAPSVSATALVLAEGATGTTSAMRCFLAAAVLAGLGLLAAAGMRATPPAHEETPAQHPPGAAGGAPRTDRFGDPLPPGAVARMGTVRFAHGDSMIVPPAVAPDHRTFATVSESCDPELRGRLVCLWDTATGRELRRLRDTEFEHYDAVFLRTENLLATFGNSRKPVRPGTSTYAVHFWDPTTGKRVAGGFESLGLPFEPWAFSKDGHFLASAGREPPVRVRDRKTGQVVAEWRGHGDGVSRLAFSPDGDTLAIASGSSRGSIRLWDWRAGRETGRLGDLPQAVERLWFSPDGRWLAAAVSEEGVRVWETRTWAEVRRLPGEHNVRFLPGGKRLVSATTGVVRDVASGEEVGRFENCRHCLTLDVSPDGTEAVGYALGRLRRWDPATGKDRSPPAPAANGIMIHQLGFLPDGRTVVSASPDGAVRLWDATSGAEVRTLVPGTTWDNSRPAFLRVTSDGTVVVARGDRLSFFRGGEGAAEVALANFPNGLTSLNVSADGKTLVLAGAALGSRVVQVWDVARRRPVADFTPPEGLTLECLGVSPRGRIAARLGDQLHLLNARTGAVERTLERRPERPPPRARGDDGAGYGYFPGIQALSFSPAGDLLASAGHPAGGLTLLDPSTGKIRHVLLPPPQGATNYELHNAVFSPDGRMLASESEPGVVDVWETASGGRRRRFVGHRSYQTALAFSPDGTRLASGNRDATILIWDVFGLTTEAAAPVTEADLPGLWDRLLDADAGRAFLAMGRLLRSPERSVPFLGRQLLGRKNPDAARLRAWLADLDSDNFQRRERASSELAKRPAEAEPLLNQALAGNPSAEMRRRTEVLLDAVASAPLTPETLRDLRALEVLEHAGDPAAAGIIRQLADGDHDPRVVAAARAARARLETPGRSSR